MDLVIEGIYEHESHPETVQREPGIRREEREKERKRRRRKAKIVSLTLGTFIIEIEASLLLFFSGSSSRTYIQTWKDV